MKERDEAVHWVARIDSGFAAMWASKPFALGGSRLSNCDRIITTPQSAFLGPIKGGETIPGLFEPGYVPPALPVQD